MGTRDVTSSRHITNLHHTVLPWCNDNNTMRVVWPQQTMTRGMRHDNASPGCHNMCQDAVQQVVGAGTNNDKVGMGHCAHPQKGFVSLLFNTCVLPLTTPPPPYDRNYPLPLQWHALRLPQHIEPAETPWNTKNMPHKGMFFMFQGYPSPCMTSNTKTCLNRGMFSCSRAPTLKPTQPVDESLTSLAV